MLSGGGAPTCARKRREKSRLCRTRLERTFSAEVLNAISHSFAQTFRFFIALLNRFVKVSAIKPKFGTNLLNQSTCHRIDLTSFFILDLGLMLSPFTLCHVQCQPCLLNPLNSDALPRSYYGSLCHLGMQQTIPHSLRFITFGMWQVPLVGQRGSKLVQPWNAVYGLEGGSRGICQHS